MPEFKDPHSDFHAFMRRAAKETDVKSFLEREEATNPLWQAEKRDADRLTNRSELRAFLENPDEDALLSSGDPKLIADGRDRASGRIAGEFVQQAGGKYHATDRNYDVIVRFLCEANGIKYTSSKQATDELFAQGLWTIAKLNAAVAQLTQEGRLEVAPGTVRNLTGQELRDVAVAIQTEGEETAVLQYVAYSLGGSLPNHLDSPRDLLAKHGPTCSRAASFIFAESQIDFIDTPEWQAYLSDHTKGRHGVLTVSLLRSLWIAFTSRGDGSGGGSGSGAPPAAPHSPQPPKPPTKEQLEDLTFEEVDALRVSTLRERSRINNAGLRSRNILGTPFTRL